MAKRIILIFLLALLPGLSWAQQGQSQDPVLVINDDGSNQSQADSSQAANAFQDPADSADAVASMQQQADTSDSVPDAIDLSGNSVAPAPAAVVAAKSLVPVRSAAKVYGPITKEDHIWSLAQKLRPTTAVTVQQMIIALQQANPQAFFGGNINGLRNGEMLRVPALSKIQAISPRLALTLVEKQNREWQQLKNPAPKKPIVKAVAKVAAPIVEPKPIAVKAALVVPAKISTLPTPNTENNVIIAKASNDAPTEMKTLQQQLLATQSDLTTYKQDSNKRLKTLEQQNALIASQMLVFNERLSGLKNEFNSKLAAINRNANWPTTWTDYLPRNKTAWWILLGAAFLIVWLWMPPAKKNQSTNKERQEPTVSGDADLKEEYDFMNTQEAIPAKLDLARAYINMDDFLSAQQVLKEVLKKGSDSERQQAQQMLGAIRT